MTYIAIAFLCLVGVGDCENNYTTRAIVGSGSTVSACFQDGMQGAAASLDIGVGYKMKLVCKAKDGEGLGQEGIGDHHMDVERGLDN